ncbi:MAG: 5-formyltetrahydrofolate cyclo-ligase [Gammaproteobacteria bacterium]|nr:MAG: 5-formyltetrahydrofolate cyclo-ligase [Gammaproteobacteria bacterium]
MPDNPTINHSQPDAIYTENRSIAHIRQLKRTQRQVLSADIQRQHSKALCQNIIKQKSYRNSQRIACYLANDGEIDPFLLIEHAWFAKKHVYLPILSPLKNSLYFAPYDENSQLRLNRFNIPEPVCQPSDWTKASQLNLLLLPLVAFDTVGNRVGMGSGFYDRTLAYLQHRQSWKKPVLMGLAHDIQKMDQLKTQSWDIPVNCIVTEKQSYYT